MRSRSVAALVAAFMLIPAGQAAATGGGHGSGDRQLEEYAAKTWASFEAMTDERSGLPSDILNADGTRSVQTSTTNIGAYMWSAVAAERLGFIGKRELEQPARAHARARSSAWSATPTGRPVLQLVRPPHGREAHDVAADRRAADADPVLGRQRLAGRRACGSSRTACRSSSRRAGALYDVDGLRLLLPAGRQPDPVPLRARHRRDAPCCYDTVVSESRIADYIGIAQGRDAAEGVLRHAGARSPTPATGVGRRRGRSATTRTYFGVERLRGRLPVRAACSSPRVGRLDVRGADARPVRARGAWAPGSLGREPPADGRAPRSTTASIEAGYGVLGLLAAEQARGRLRRSTASTASGMDPERRPVQRGPHAGRPRLRGLPGPSGRSRTRRRRPTRTASSPRTPRSSALRYAPDATLRNLARLAARLPGHVQPSGASATA